MPARKPVPKLPSPPVPGEKPKRQPRGGVKPWTVAEIERRSAITDADLEVAASTWRRHSVPVFRTILDAPDSEDVVEPDA
jgi:hypothetical protein